MDLVCRQIRTEDRIDEAKISEPNTFYFPVPIDHVIVAEYDAIQEGESLRLIPESRKNVRRYEVRQG